MPAPNDPTSFSLLLARWLDRRLDDAAAGLFAAPRWYGLEILDAEALVLGRPEAVRAVYLGDCAFDAMQAHDRFDALGHARHRWLLVGQHQPRPGAWSPRRRARTVEVTMGMHTAGVARFEGDGQLLEFPPAA
ncbi:MAG: hypothetical protein ACKPDI_10310 [Actinomycetota bacterium]